MESLLQVITHNIELGGYIIWVTLALGSGDGYFNYEPIPLNVALLPSVVEGAQVTN